MSLDPSGTCNIFAKFSPSPTISICTCPFACNWSYMCGCLYYLSYSVPVCRPTDCRRRTCTATRRRTLKPERSRFRSTTRATWPARTSTSPSTVRCSCLAAFYLSVSLHAFSSKCTILLALSLCLSLGHQTRRWFMTFSQTRA